MAIDFDDNETYDLFMDAFDKALQLSTVENRGRVRQMFRDQMKQTDAAIARAEAAERELAELEARLAMLEAQAVDWDWQPTEQEWRSVTELPKEEDFYLTWDGYEIVGRWYSSYYEDDVLAWRDEFNEQQEGITHWRPLPPPPAATE